MKSHLPWVQLTQEESFGFMPRLSVFYEHWCPESGRGQQRQSERQRHTAKSPYYTQRKMDRETVRARSRDRDTESSVPCGSGAPEQRSSTVSNWVCTQSPIIQTAWASLLSEGNYSATLPPAFHGTLWESTQRLKVLWDTGVSFSDMEVGIHGLNLWKLRKWHLAPGFCQMEDRQCAWRRHSGKQRYHVAPWSPRKPGEGGGGGTEVIPLVLGACPWSMTPTTLSANG